MSLYLLGLMKADAVRQLTQKPRAATVTRLLVEARKSLRRGHVTASEFTQLTGHILGSGFAQGAIGENDVIKRMKALRARR